MTGNIVGEEFDEFVFEEIKFRQQTQYSGYDDTRDFNTIKYQNNKNAWVKLASSVEVSDRSYLGLDTADALIYGPLHYEGSNKLKKIFEDDTISQKFMGMELAKQAILFNGLSYAESTIEEGEVVIVEKGGERFFEKQTITNITGSKMRSGISGEILGNQAYGIGGSEMGLQPIPGIKDVSIECVHRGSIRKANISIIAFNKKQFEIIELLYLRLGYTILLEWGNDKYHDGEKWNPVGNTLVEDFFFKEQGTTQLEVLRKIQEYRRKYRGNYDGFFGKVVNFNWEYGPSGTYNITLQLVTLGDVIESLQVNIPTTSISAEDIKTQISLAQEKSNKVQKSFSVETSITLLQEGDSPIITQASNNIIGKWLFSLISNPNLWEGREDTKYFSLKNNPYRSTDPNEWKHKTVNASLSTSNNRENYNYFITFQELMFFIERNIIPLIDNGKGEKKLRQLDIETNIENTRVSYFPNQISFDPRICIFKYGFNGTYEKDGSILSLQGVNQPSQTYLKNLKYYIVVRNGVAYGQLMNLYLNLDFIAKCSEQNTDEKGKLSLFKFLKSLCSGINNALGGVNNIEPIIKDDRIITFIDQNPIPGLFGILEKKDTVDLEFYGYSPEISQSNFVKDISFKTEITPDLASMITIGTTGGGSSTKNIDATAFSKWNTGLIDRFSLAIIDPNEEFNNTLNLTEEEEKYKNEWETYGKKVVETIEKGAAQGLQLASRTEYGIIQGIKEINYKGIKGIFTEQEYINLRKAQVEQNIIPIEELASQRASNYILYLVDSFGGNSNLTIGFTNKWDGKDSIKTGGGVTTENKKFGGYTKKYKVFSINSQYTDFNPDFISRGKNVFKTHINTINNATFKNSNPQNPSNTLGFIPVSLNITLEGISGIKIYNKLNLNNKYLPHHYPQSFHFLITKVNHKISNNTWETSLSTLSIPNIPNDSVKSTFGSSNSSTLLGFNGMNLGDPPFEERGPIPSTGPFIIIENRKEDALRDKNNYGGAEQQINIDKILNEIHPEARPSFKKFFDELISKYPGYTLKVNAIGRTLQRSAELKNQNSNNSSPGFSKHNYYASIDFNITDPNKNTLYKNDRYGWLKSGIPDLAVKCGLRWGGDFSNYIDAVHFDYWFDINVAYKNLQTQVLGKGNEGPLRDEDFSKVDIHQISLK